MKNELNSQIGKRIRMQRELMGYSRERFAELLDISVRFVTDIELGNKGMSFNTLIKICNLLSISSDYVLMGKTDESVKTSKLNKLSSQIDEKYTPYAEDILSLVINMIEVAEGTDN